LAREVDSGGVATHLERSSYGSAEFLDRTGFDEMEPVVRYMRGIGASDVTTVHV
jgi:hypothetical protein